MSTTLLAVALTALIGKLPLHLKGDWLILVCIVLTVGLTALEKYVPGYQDFVPGLTEALTATGLVSAAGTLFKKAK